MAHHFSLIDVFESGPMTGNPLAVLDGVGVPEAEMTAICRWLNFSETAFLLPASDPAADYQVRIFTPERELPFAGHPTLGTCHVWLERGGRPKSAEIVQQCGAGQVRIRRDGDRLAFCRAAADPVGDRSMRPVSPKSARCWIFRSARSWPLNGRPMARAGRVSGWRRRERCWR
ncbi:MAG: PhzF family phenazine biosynthesis isomerase [Asticcacaulis sp.]